MWSQEFVSNQLCLQLKRSQNRQHDNRVSCLCAKCHLFSSTYLFLGSVFGIPRAVLYERGTKVFFLPAFLLVVRSPLRLVLYVPVWWFLSMVTSASHMHFFLNIKHMWRTGWLDLVFQKTALWKINGQRTKWTIIKSLWKEIVIAHVLRKITIDIASTFNTHKWLRINKGKINDQLIISLFLKIVLRYAVFHLSYACY